MKIADDQLNPEHLRRSAEIALNLIHRHDYSNLVEHFGYAVANGRDHVSAVSDDLNRCLREIGHPLTENVAINPHAFDHARLVIHGPNETGLTAVFQCVSLAKSAAAEVFADFVVFPDETGGYDVSLEDIYTDTVNS